jgi:hypothetical protein
MMPLAGVEQSQSICIGCGCTDLCACEGGCSWLACDGVTGVCSRCSFALDSWDAGVGLVGSRPEIPTDHHLLVQLNGLWVREYRAGAGLKPGTYHVLNEDSGTVRLVDEQGRPAGRAGDALRLTYQPDWDEMARRKALGLRRGPTPDDKRGDQMRIERRRNKAKAAKRSRQAQRRRS